VFSSILSDSCLIIHPVSKLLRNWDVFIENRNICGTYCEGCSQLLPSNISDGHCCFREHSKHSFLMHRRFQPSRQHSDALIRLCLAILAGADCRTSESLLLSMSYPSSLILFMCFLCLRKLFIILWTCEIFFVLFFYKTYTLRTVIIKLLMILVKMFPSFFYFLALIVPNLTWHCLFMICLLIN
jgi:hypothetical protein